MPILSQEIKIYFYLKENNFVIIITIKDFFCYRRDSFTINMACLHFLFISAKDRELCRWLTDCIGLITESVSHFSFLIFLKKE